MARIETKIPWRKIDSFGTLAQRALLGMVVLACSDGALQGTREVTVAARIDALHEAELIRMQLPFGETVLDGMVSAEPSADGLLGDLQIVAETPGGDSIAEAHAHISLPPVAEAGDQWFGQTTILIDPTGPTGPVELLLISPGSLPDSDLSIAPKLLYAPDLISVSFEDPAVVSSLLPISVVASDRDSAPETLSVELSVTGPSPTDSAVVPLELVGLTLQGGQFTGEFPVPSSEGEYELLISVDDPDGGHTEETKIAFAQAGRVTCSYRCIKQVGSPPRDVVTKEGTRTTTTEEACRTLCNRICFGPQGNGATHVECSH
jgi:hypothetical protein